MTLREFLTALTPYSVPDAYLDTIGEEIGADLDADFSDCDKVEVNRAKARVYFYFATTPNISEGGVSISFTASEKKLYMDLARKYAALAGETTLIPGASYGYKGENL